MNGENHLTYDILSRYRGFLMGLSILSIIIHHYTEDCAIYKWHYAAESWQHFYQYYISSSGVDAFIFFSGFGLYFSLKHRYQLVYFFRKRLVKIIIPFLIVAVPYLYWFNVIWKQNGRREMLRTLFFVNFLKKGNTSYWYILLILICYLIFPLVFRIIDGAGSQKAELAAALALSAVTTAFSLFLLVAAPDKYDHWNIALARFPLFFIGCYIGKCAYNKRKMSIWTFLVMIACIPVMLLFREGATPLIRRYILAYMNISICMAVAVLMYYLSSRKYLDRLYHFLMAVFGFLGTYSLEIYLTHVTVRNVMKQLEYRTCYIRYELIMVGISLLLSLLLHRVSGGIENLLPGSRVRVRLKE